jgi:hypothetical protein
MLKRLIILFLLTPAFSFAQFTDDFEDADISDWTESTVGRWAASDISPLTGAYSLHHIFNNTIAEKDRVSIELPTYDLSVDTIKWRFRIKYEYNPSDGNNWCVYLLSNADASQMVPGGNINGYVIGVNFTGDDDILKLLKITSGSPSAVIITSLDWDANTDLLDTVALEISRSKFGDWEVFYNANADFNNLISIGTGNDLTYTATEYFGVYYDYTLSADQLLWVDDIQITGEIYVDNDPPVVDSVHVLSYKNLKLEFNEKIDSAIGVNPLNFLVDGGIGIPDSVIVDATSRNAELFFSQKFVDNQLYSLDIQSVEDLNGNIIKDTTVNFMYEYIKPIGVEVISANEIQLEFSRNLDTVSAEDPINYSLDNSAGNPILAEVVVGDSAKVRLQFGADFINKTEYNLTIQNVADRNLDSLQTEIISFTYFVPEPFDVVINEVMADPNPVVNLPDYEYIEIKNTTEFEVDLSGWKLKVGTTVKDFPSYILNPDSYLTLCSTSAYADLSVYGNALGITSFPLVTNAGTSIVIFDDNDIIIDSINFTTAWYNDPVKDDGGWSIERIDPLNTCSGITNWKASVDANGGTPGTENSVYSSNMDTQAPLVQKINLISNNQIRLFFNEPLAQNEAENNVNYVVNNSIGNPTTSALNTNLTEVDLTFSNLFTDETNYTITIVNLEDLCANAMSSTNIDFTYYETKPFDVVINEILADPDPVVGLPEFEYLEIYNTSDFDLDLSGWKLKTGTSVKDFPDSIIASSSYVILCSETAADYLQTYGDVIKFSSFSAISNSGGPIVLYDKNNLVIDSINFTLDWYNDAVKEDGGWSIERIDPLNECSSITNWTVSIDANGGTPGTENSVFASNIDSEAPEIVSVEIISGNQLKIGFNEPVTEESLVEKSNYTINKSIGNPFSILVGADLKEVDLLFINSFPEEEELKLSIENLSDECGNIITSLFYNFIYYVVRPFDIVINEIMADPEPVMALPEFEYIEIYNTSDYAISLSEWTLTVGSTIRSLSSQTIESHSYLTLCNSEAAAELQIFGDVLVVSGFPSLANTEQTVILHNKSGEIISRVSYSDDWYQNEFKSDGGWSLEQIDPMNPCGGENNWVASESETGGTPGQQNSVYANNPDTEAPELLRITVVDEQNIQLFFSESIDSLSAMQTEIYNVDNNIGNPVFVDMVGSDYKSIILGFSNSFDQNVVYTLDISGGIFDCAGNEIADKNSAQFSLPFLPVENDLVINEILFNPLPDGFDFVEVYNRSDKTIDLKDLLIASYDDEKADYSSIKVITEEGYLVFPDAYVVLTEEPEAVKRQYTTTNPEGFVKLNDLPGYNDDKGRVILLDKQQNIIDNFEYDEDMQFALLATNEGVSLERINYNRPTDDKSNWHSASQLVGFATPAYENSQFMELEDIIDDVQIEPEVFSPDNDGYEDVANISFTFDKPGYVANIKIYDSKGRLIKYLANNQLLGIEGIISWDGLDDKNQKAPVGIYVVFIEIFDLEGNVKQYKKSIVVAARY